MRLLTRSFRSRYILLIATSLTVGITSEAKSQNIDSLQQQISALFGKSCAIAGCHAGPIPQQGMDLTNENFLSTTVGVSSKEKPEFLRVDPGNPDSSYLLMKVIGDDRITGVQMPLTGDKLASSEVELIRDWINGLTEENVGDARGGGSTEKPYDFLGWKVVNLPTNRRVEKGLFLFLIGHRFNPRISSGYETLFGLDGSGIIFLNLGYAVTDRLFVNVGRSNAQDDVEIDVKYSLFDERTDNVPLSISGHVAVNWISQKQSGESRLRGEVLKPSLQVILSKAIGTRAGVAVVPGILANPDPSVSGEDPFVTLGLGGRFALTDRFALVAEWVPILTGFERSNLFGNDIRFDSWAGGIEIATSGHVFQIVGTNTVAITTDQYFRGGDLDITEGHFRLGFNIFRVLRF